MLDHYDPRSPEAVGAIPKLVRLMHETGLTKGGTMRNSEAYAMEDRCYVAVMTVFATILFFVVFPIFVCVGLCSALAVYVYRGSSYVSWRRPGDCLNSLDWAFCEWDYYGLGGQQTGVRVFGIEVAYAGLLR